MSTNLLKKFKNPKSLFSQIGNFLKILVFFAKKKNFVPLILPLEEISLRPELSTLQSTPFQNTLSVTDEGRTKDDRKSWSLILDYLLWQHEARAQRTYIKSHCGRRASLPTLSEAVSLLTLS